MPYYLEFSTPTTNYTSFINWNNSNIISFNILNNNQSIANGSGLYRYDLSKGLSVNLTEMNPNHIGDIFINYDGNLRVNASRLLGGELMIGLSKGRIEIQAERAFFFFKQNFLLNFYYNLQQSTFNLTLLLIHL
jgi:hypothetical protein